jgi:hypothetical protein
LTFKDRDNLTVSEMKNDILNLPLAFWSIEMIMILGDSLGRNTISWNID